ncbi:MAG: hypothetical protein AAGE89_08230 [Pseudomonadota bacterium]
MYNQDSFFDLSGLGQMGLILISLTLFVLTILAARYLLLGKPIWIKLPGALVIFWSFVWLSPQVYYMYYYLIIFESLPLQWVIWPPESPLEALQLLFFQGPHNLSAHGKGILGWGLILAPFVKWGGRRA